MSVLSALLLVILCTCCPTLTASERPPNFKVDRFVDNPLITAKKPEHALRDPAILIDDGHIYLYYSIAGENGIAGAELFVDAMKP